MDLLDELKTMYKDLLTGWHVNVHIHNAWASYQCSKCGMQMYTEWDKIKECPHCSARLDWNNAEYWGD